MKAVNLIPDEAARVAGPKLGAGSGSIGAYAVLAALAIAVVMAGTWAMTSKQLDERAADLARVEQEAQAAEAKVSALKPYTEFSALSKARVETVGGLVAGRFDWAHGLREVARVIPGNVDLISLTGSVSPQSQVEGGAAGTLRGALALPAIDLTGCATSQSAVARLLARLRAVDGVKRVSLASSEKSDAAGGGSDCRKTSKMPQFQVTVFFRSPGGIVPAAAAAGTQPASAPGTAAPSTAGPSSAAPAPSSSTASAGGTTK